MANSWNNSSYFPLDLFNFLNVECVGGSSYYIIIFNDWPYKSSI